MNEKIAGWKNSLLGRFKSEIAPLFDLKIDVDEPGAIESVVKNIEFHGANVWILVFAIFIASIGLNVNSTAVIIGAMLISPLMGPIVGAGLSLGVNDFGVLKKALKNLLTATVVSVLTSTLYFLVSPLNQAQTELLARTQPTLYDVLIALFGGAAGIVAGTRKDRVTNVVPGVAIATALMPPLCTAGYGLANGQMSFFIGAIYLYFINSIFICLATFVTVRALGFKKKTFVDQSVEKKTNLYMAIFAILAVIPATYTGYKTVTEAIFQSRVDRFAAECFQFSNTKVIERKVRVGEQGNSIEITLVGAPLPAGEKDKIRSRMTEFGLEGVGLVITEASASSIKEMEERLSQNLKSNVLEKLYGADQMALKSKDERIHVLEEELLRFKVFETLVSDAGREIESINGKIISIGIGLMPMWESGKTDVGSKLMVVLSWKRPPSKGEKQQLEQFLKIRTKDEKTKFMHLNQ